MNQLYIEIGVKYVHFLSIFLIIASLASEYILLKPQLSRKQIMRISIIDGIYGISSISLLIAGFSLWFWIGKPAEFYSKNWIFMTKLTLFIVVGLLSIYPTIFFLKNRKGDTDEMVDIPKRIKNLIRIELVILFLIPLLATLMSKGIGFTN